MFLDNFNTEVVLILSTPFKASTVHCRITQVVVCGCGCLNVKDMLHSSLCFTVQELS